MIVTFSVVYFILTKPFTKKKTVLKEMDALSRFLLCIAFVLVVFSFTAVSIVFSFLASNVDEPNNVHAIIGNLGNALSGIMTPFIAISAVIVTGLAFYMQFQANQQIQNQFKLQQFEAQFYEMIRLHRENLNEMKIEGYVFQDYRGKKEKINKQTTGKKVFITMISELTAIYTIVIKIYMDTNQDAHFKYSNGRILPSSGEKAKVLFRLAYDIFFGGIVLLNKKGESLGFDGLFLTKVKDQLEKVRFMHETEGKKKTPKFIELTRDLDFEKIETQTLRLNFNYRPFSGHQSRLAHYYRHLYMSVKYVVKQSNDLLPYEKKREYLRLLRAQLSNHEHVLLYYNWLVGNGDSWEETNVELREKRSSGNYFFTDYRMIHNLSPFLVLEEFDPELIFDERYRSFECEKGRGVHGDTLFELISLSECKELPRFFYN